MRRVIWQPPPLLEAARRETGCGRQAADAQPNEWSTEIAVAAVYRAEEERVYRNGGSCWQVFATPSD
jgi:hypothetical protein